LTVDELNRIREALAPLHAKLGKPKPGDWLATYQEDGQTFAEYLKCSPVTPNGERRIIYVQPLGDFTPEQRRIITVTSDFMSRFFDRPVKLLDDLSLSAVPESARRLNPYGRQLQLDCSYILGTLLPPRLPADGAACIAFTATDLWPGQDRWNFVFGQAELRDRVGVWSLSRNGNPSGGEEAFRLCLLRTIKTAVHETGHMFTLQHCIAWQCVMNGSNNLEEADRQPLALCPECLAKICWATGAEPVARYRRLAEFCQTAGLDEQRAFYQKSITVLGGRP
jgi:archaemetzincin